MPPQRAWPSTMTLATSSLQTANSMAELTPGGASGVHGGTRLAILRTTNMSPGSLPVSSMGSTRESQQPISKVVGRCPSRRLSYKVCGSLKYCC